MAKSKGLHPGPQPQQLPNVQVPADLFGPGGPSGALGAQTGTPLGGLGGLAQQQGSPLGMTMAMQQRINHQRSLELAFWWGRKRPKTGPERHEAAVKDLLDE
jgi:hypothetical protein